MVRRPKKVSDLRSKRSNKATIILRAMHSVMLVRVLVNGTEISPQVRLVCRERLSKWYVRGPATILSSTFESIGKILIGLNWVRNLALPILGCPRRSSSTVVLQQAIANASQCQLQFLCRRIVCLLKFIYQYCLSWRHWSRYVE